MNLFKILAPAIMLTSSSLVFANTATQVVADKLIEENPCVNYMNSANPNSRTKFSIEIDSLNAEEGYIYSGIAYEGDVVVVSQESDKSIVEIYACNRPNVGSNNAINLTGQSTLNFNNACSTGEVTAMDFVLKDSTGAGYSLNFYPVYMDSINKTQAGSELCPGLLPFAESTVTSAEEDEEVSTSETTTLNTSEAEIL